MNWNHVSKYRSELMGISCLWIMFFHNFFKWPKSLDLLHRVANRGNLGVEVFLLLSGIGLYYSYTKSMSMPTGTRVRQFYLRRLIRLAVPNVLLVLPFYLWFSIAKQTGVEGFLKDFFQISLWQNGMTRTWYLTASAVFYLLFPGIYYIQQKDFYFKGKKIERNLVTGILCLLAFILCRCLLRFAPVFFKHCEILVTRVIIFIVGCSLGKEVKEEKSISATAVFVSAVLVFFYVFWYGRENTFTRFWERMTYVGVGLMVLIIFTYVFTKLDRCTWIRKFFAFFGERSLELYLTHIMIKRIWLVYIGKNAFDRWHVLSYACIILGSILLSILIHPLIQYLSKKLLRRVR